MRSFGLVLVTLLGMAGCSLGWPGKGTMSPRHVGVSPSAASKTELADWLNDPSTALARRAKEAGPSPEPASGGSEAEGPPAPDPAPLMQQAVAALERGDLEEARRLARAVLALDPKGYPYAHVILGDVALAERDWDTALLSYRKALALDPSDGWATQRIAQVLALLGKVNEARELLRGFVANHPYADADTWDALAWLELDLGDAKRAEAAFCEALAASDGGDAEAHYGLAMIHARRGDALLVEKDLTALFALKPGRRLVLERDPTFFRMRIHPNVAALFSPKAMAEAKLAAPLPTPGADAKLAVPGGPAKSLSDVVRFDFDSAKLKSESKTVLDEIAAFLVAQKQVEFVRVTGHADRRGDEAYNVKLSEQRARAVRDALVLRGVPASLLVVKGYGIYCPLDDGDDETAFAKNRRVQFAIASGGKVLGEELSCLDRMKDWLGRE